MAPLVATGAKAVAVAVKSPSSTPARLSDSFHGAIYASSPGGTRITYSTDMLMELQTSPSAKTPPAAMDLIPGVTKGMWGSESVESQKKEEQEQEIVSDGCPVSIADMSDGEDLMFQLDE